MSKFDIDAVDLTADLVDGSDGAFADTHNANDAVQAAPPGTRNVNAPDEPAERVQPVAKPEDTSKELTLRDQLSNAFKGNEPPAADPLAGTPGANADTPALVRDAEGKYRQSDGTFASAEQVAAFEAANNTPLEAPQSPVLSGMTPLEAQQFQSLPAEIRQLVERTMEGLNSRASQYSEYDAIEQTILGPRRQAFANEGTSPLVALNQLFALSDFAGRDPGAFVLWYADQQKLNLDALLDARDAATQNVDPVVQGLQQQVQQLTGTVQQFQQQTQTAAHAANLETVQSFASEKDASGALKRPYITDITQSWATHISTLRAANPNMPNHEVLQKAYDNACWSDPAVRAKMQQAATTVQARTAQARVAAAKQAGGSVVGAPAGDANTHANNPSRTIREELEAQFAAARAI